MQAHEPVVWPRSAKTIQSKPLAPRLDKLEGKTVAFLWDYLFRGDEIWGIVKAELGARHAGMRFVDHEVFGSTHGEDEHRVLAELPARLKENRVDAVVSGMGC